MKKFKTPISFLSCVFAISCALFSSLAINAQNFENPDLEGTVSGSSTLPAGWQNVSIGDPVSAATNNNIGNTPDLTNTASPNLELGLNGNAYSGSTFMSGARLNNSVIFDEGIQQTVSGFTIGENYTITFYQTVVKQIAALDGSGSWAVYMDNQLLTVTEVSTSDLIYNSNNLVWDERSVNFTPTSASHTFKFMPTDDDTNLAYSFTDQEAGLRMGIDLININTNCTLDLGEDLILCESELPFEIGTSLSGTYDWSTGETTATIEISESGTYTLEINADCGVLSDEISIEVIPDPQAANLGPDIQVCPDDFPVVLSTDSEGEYFWSTNETTQSILVDEVGEYSVIVSNACGSVSDEIIITENLDGPILDLGGELLVCEEDFPLTIDAGEYDTYQWNTGENTQFYNVENEGSYTLTVTNSCGESSATVVVEILNPPNEVSLGDDLEICENLFPVQLVIPSTPFDIQWTTGSNSESISVNSPGIYSVEVSNLCGVSESSIAISSIPNGDEEESLTICEGQSIDFLGETFSQEGIFELVIPGDEGQCDIFWNVNIDVIPLDTITETLQIDESGVAVYDNTTFNEPGTYFITETVEGGCDLIVEIFVEDISDIYVYVPNAFSPNDDGLNDIFKPVVTLEGQIKLNFFEFEVYDRWGKIVYESNDYLRVGWNGSGESSKDYYAQDGIYTWMIRYGTSETINQDMITGSVLLLR